MIERAEKQALLAKQARRVINLLDDTPIVPGDQHPAYDGTEPARNCLNDAEDELRAWRSTVEPIHSNAGTLASGAVPAHPGQAADAIFEKEAAQQKEIEEEAARRVHGESAQSVTSESTTTENPPYPVGQGMSAS